MDNFQKFNNYINNEGPHYGNNCTLLLYHLRPKLSFNILFLNILNPFSSLNERQEVWETCNKIIQHNYTIRLEFRIFQSRIYGNASPNAWEVFLSPLKTRSTPKPVLLLKLQAVSHQWNYGWGKLHSGDSRLGIQHQETWFWLGISATFFSYSAQIPARQLCQKLFRKYVTSEINMAF
jgi:hypothetical protein